MIFGRLVLVCVKVIRLMYILVVHASHARIDIKFHVLKKLNMKPCYL